MERLNTAQLAHDFLEPEPWISALSDLARWDHLNTRLSGFAAAILLERGAMESAELSQEVSRRLSKGTPAELGAGWFQGLSMRNRYALIARLSLWQSLSDYLDTLDEPVVLFLYGDHKPWLGNGASIYQGLGINLDTATQEGFLNYYSTWYLIWGNQAAKAQLGNPFQGEGPDLSPCFLMDEVFRQCGWEGPAYMQAQREAALALPVLHTTGWVKENGQYTQTPSPAGLALVEKFQGLSAFARKGEP